MAKDLKWLSKRDMLEVIVLATNNIRKRLRRIERMNQQEQQAIDDVKAGVAKLGTDVGKLKDDAVQILQAKDNIINDLQTRLQNAQTQAGVDAATIQQDQLTIDQTKQAAADASTNFVSSLQSVSESLKATDEAVVAADTSISSAPVPAPEPVPPINIDTTVPVDTLDE